MDLDITSVSFAKHDEKEGFIVNYSVEHQSLSPMPIEDLIIEVKLNNKLAGRTEFDPKDDIKERIVNNYSIFVPANHISEVARESLKYNPMLQLQADVLVNLLVETDDDTEDAKFNQSATYQGIIHYVNN